MFDASDRAIWNGEEPRHVVIRVAGRLFGTIIHQEDEGGGYWAEVPSMPGCSTEGETLGELMENLGDVIDAWLTLDLSALGYSQ